MSLSTVFEVAPWQWGVLTSCAGSLLGTVGVQLRILSDALTQCSGCGVCAAAARRAESCTCCGAPLTKGKRRAQCLQLVGWTSWIIGQALGQAAILLAPATIVACVTFSSALLCNTILAPIVLHEQLTKAHWFGVLLLSGGGSAVTASAAHADQLRYTPEHLLALSTRGPFLILAAVCFSVAIVISVAAVRKARLDVWTFAYVFALCGSVDLIVTKCTLLMLTAWVVAPEAVGAPTGLLVAVLATMTVTLHLSVLGCQVVSTRYGEALQNTPLFLGSGAVMQVALCGTFFDEFATFGSERTCFFLAGFSLVLVGLGVTSRAAQPERPLPPKSQLGAPLLDPTTAAPPASTAAGPVQAA